MNWNTLDLNLLRVLDAMLRERNTTRVGERIGLSQPAVSSALNRLRTILGNALFVREGNRMVPTPFAESLEEPLRQALDRIELALSGGCAVRPWQIDAAIPIARRRLPVGGAPSQARDALVGHCSGYAVSIASDKSAAARATTVRRQPRHGVRVRGRGASGMGGPILALHGAPTPVASKNNERLARAGVQDREMIPLDLFCDMPQVFFGPEGRLAGEEDAALARIGRRRHVVMTVPDFFSVGRIAAQTELLGLLPDKFALSIADALGLRIYSMPFEMPLIPLHLCWHRRYTDDPEHRWMRERILELLEPLDALRHPVSLAVRKGPAARNSARTSKAPIGSAEASDLSILNVSRNGASCPFRRPARNGRT